MPIPYSDSSRYIGTPTSSAKKFPSLTSGARVTKPPITKSLAIVHAVIDSRRASLPHQPDIMHFQGLLKYFPQPRVETGLVWMCDRRCVRTMRTKTGACIFQKGGLEPAGHFLVWDAISRQRAQGEGEGESEKR